MAVQDSDGALALREVVEHPCAERDELAVGFALYYLLGDRRIATSEASERLGGPVDRLLALQPAPHRVELTHHRRVEELIDLALGLASAALACALASGLERVVDAGAIDVAVESGDLRAQLPASLATDDLLQDLARRLAARWGLHDVSHVSPRGTNPVLGPLLGNFSQRDD